MAVSFKGEILPIFDAFKGEMMWRFDLTNYDHVKANANLIYSRINVGGGMPPTPFPPLTIEQIQLFQRWMEEGFAP